MMWRGTALTPCYYNWNHGPAMTMLESSLSIPNLEDLRTYVAGVLGSLESLKSDEYELSQQVLYRKGNPCGVHFRLQGPRALCLSAIWETEKNSVLFYGSCGRRVLRTKLIAGPELRLKLAR